MKSPTNVVDDCDDIFGPPRTCATGYCAPKTRPSMISAKYRQKEERRKVLKISINKLKKIEDPEASLCRSVLINNTMKRLQREARDEKTLKQQLHYPRYEDSFLTATTGKVDQGSKDSQECDAAKIMDSLKADFESDFDNKLICESEEQESVVVHQSFAQDMNDCDVQDVLSQFYMPPTPRMLTCIDDDDEDVNVVDDDEPLPKRTKLECQDSFSSTIEDHEDVVNRLCCFPQEMDATQTSLPSTPTPNSYSTCGHASIFNDLQNNVFHSLIASLET